MGNQIYTYALVKSLYDTGKDYIDCFCPFIIQELPKGVVKHVSKIQEDVKETTRIAIPQYTLKTILKRAKKREYVDNLGHGKYKITNDGLKFLTLLDTQEIVQSKLTELSKDFSSFLSSKLDEDINEDEAFSILTTFIESNLILVLDYINPNIEYTSQNSSVSKKGVDKYIANYIEHAHVTSPNHYETIREIILGCTLSIALFCPDISAIKEKFKSTTLFIDSNFVFNILGFHYDEFSAPAKELFRMLKDYGFKIKIFNITVDEICNVINRFSNYENLYPSNIKIASIYSRLKTKGWTKIESRDFILSIEDKLSELGIQIEHIEDLDINSYIPSDEQVRLNLEKYKPGQLRTSQNHDLISIEQIRNKRRHSVRSLQNAKFFFLTCDLKLAKFNFEQFGHKSNGTISEVIPDFLLANCLWLQNPEISLEMPLKLLISTHSQHLFVDRKVWERFINILRDLNNTSSISDEKIATLLYHGRVEELLKDIDETQCDIISREFVIEQAEKTAAEIDVKFAKKLKDKENEVRSLLEKKLSEHERQKNQEWLSSISEIKKNLRKSVAKKASLFAFLISALCSIVILAVSLIFICLGLKKCDKDHSLTFITIVVLVISVLLGSGGIIGIWRDLYNFLKIRLSEKFYTKRIKETGLENDN